NSRTSENEIVPDEFRCNCSNGKQCGCKRRALEGKKMSETHTSQLSKKRKAAESTKRLLSSKIKPNEGGIRARGLGKPKQRLMLMKIGDLQLDLFGHSDRFLRISFRIFWFFSDFRVTRSGSVNNTSGDSEDEEEEEEKEKEGEKEGGRKKKKNFLDEEADEVPIAGEADTYEFDPVQGSFTANNTFAKNLNSLVSSLSSLTPKVYGFYSLTSGNSSGEPAYAIALCKREVKRHDCLRCIQTAARNITELYPGKKEDIVWYTHCMFRYSNRVIYGKKETDPTPGFIASEKISADRVEFQRLQRGLFDRLKGIAAAGGSNRKYAQGNGSASTGYRRFYGMAQCTPDLSEQDCNDCLDFGLQSMSICCDAVVATDTFSQENELGRGGFGSVYKGMFSDGQEIAVKRLSNTSGEGDIEIKNEIILLAKLRHRNLARLLGFCIKGEERLLVYEFIKNASLDRFIFADLEKRQLLDWGMRYKMIEGVHRCQRIIHRDLKASKILLDQEMNPKIADFGLAKVFEIGQTM
ncbi:unnamed protein product, partial [Brassica oleracea]